MFILCKFIISTDESYKQQYITYYYNFKNLVNFFPESSLILKYEIIKSKTDNLQQSNLSYDVRWETNHKRLFLAALDTWKSHKIFGNGIKSFRIDCPKLAGPDINLEEDLHPDKKNRLCSNHPHNYYLEILTDTGMVGLITIFMLAFLFVVFIFKNLKIANKINIENLVLLSAIISLASETIPLRSSGSIFTTNNATYLVLIGSIVLSYKELFKTNIE